MSLTLKVEDKQGKYSCLQECLYRLVFFIFSPHYRDKFNTGIVCNVRYYQTK